MAKLLLVEDDMALRDIYSTRFLAEGYEVVTASDGEQALTVAVKEKPDLILLDIMMPKISGFDVLDILRTTPETKNCKVVIMTALSQPADIDKGKMLGADEYLVKSQVTLTDVVNKVKEVLSK
jgi:DNA-binding response OmpR family regulator